jgi:hypothetical protein
VFGKQEGGHREQERGPGEQEQDEVRKKKGRVSRYKAFEADFLPRLSPVGMSRRKKGKGDTPLKDLKF